MEAPWGYSPTAEELASEDFGQGSAKVQVWAGGWEPDFPPFPARVTYFIATGKWISYEELVTKIMEAHRPKTIKVAITADTTEFDRAMNQAMKNLAVAMQRIGRPHQCWYKPWTWRMRWDYTIAVIVLAFFAFALFYALGQPV